MDLNLSGKVAVVLGASHGLGLGVATALAEEGCNLALCSRSFKEINEISDQLSFKYKISVLPFALDISIAADLEDFIDEVINFFGFIDILVNNGGGPKPSPALSLTNNDFKCAYELILMSKVNASLRVLPGMIARGGGVIINLESTSAKEPIKNMSLSNTFRAASLAFAKTIAMEYARYGITVKTILTGPFLTRRVSELGVAFASDQGIEFDEWLSNSTQNVPLQRFGDPLEFGKLIAFLASDKALFMTGNSIALDGGVLSSL